MSPIDAIRQEITLHPSNEWARDLGYEPVFAASPTSKIVIVGQAPGRNAQTTMTPWNDISGDTLRRWLQLDKEVFYNDQLIALMPMDFYYPGKAAHGDLPPRKSFAPQWHPKLLAHMPQVELFLLIGAYAQAYYLNDKRLRNLTETVAAFEQYLPLYAPLVHPSPLNTYWQSKNPWFLESVIPVIRTRVHRVLGVEQAEA